MREFYATAPVAVRTDLAAAHARAWERIGRPGTWWGAAERVVIAAETRQARSCTLCRRRLEALSPDGVAGAHDGPGRLAANLVEAVHRIATDPARLSERWYRDILAGGLTPEEYVETVSIVAHTVAIDTFATGLGLEPMPLPMPAAGPASRRRPAGAGPGPAWVPWVEPEDMTEAEAGIYPQGRPVANIMKAMSLVPEEVRSFFDLVRHQYQSPLEMRDFSREYRAISHAQIELLAARVSALNHCLY